jgi:predicted ATPase/class 3 adenylate cyclase
MNKKPSGTVTFLFSDIEGSTQKWEENAEQMQVAFARQEAIIRKAMSEHGGYVYKMIGDAFQVAFDTAPEALAAANSTQNILQREPWGDIGPVWVRMALHTGVVEERGDDYVGPILNRTARLMNAGHGGQVLLSQATYELVRDNLPDGVSLSDLGEHRLKDLTRPEHVFQLVAPNLESRFPPLLTLDAHPNNLPLQLTSFIGRERELDEVKQKLATSRLVTLIGPGGTGKSRLALQIAADLTDRFNQGVWFVDFCALTEPGLVPQSVSTVLSIREEGQRPLIETLGEGIGGKEILLVLDNCEHLIEACARFSDALLRACPGLRILATSREALRIGGEMTNIVLPLETPDPEHLPAVEALSQYDAVRLFIERSVAVSPDFKIDNSNAPAVAQICYRLDGIPLALELASARVGAITVDMILDRLDDRFRLLSKGDRAVLPRHQTLEAVIDWSYELLAERECALFRRLGVFAGGWTLEAAESMCCGEGIRDWEILELMTSLVDKSLVQIDRSQEETRYRMLESVRQYAWQKASITSEAEEIRSQYISYYLQLAEEGEKKSYWGGDTTLPKRLAVDFDNFRTALVWCFEDVENYGELGLRLAGALWIVWWTFGYLNEGRDWLERAIESDITGGAPRAKALTNLGCIAWQQGDYQIAGGHTKESITIYRDQVTEDRPGLANAIHIRGHVIFDQKDYSQARSLFEESLTKYRQLEDQENILLLVSDLGMVDYHEGDYQSAKLRYEECLGIARQREDLINIVNNLLRIGDIARLERDYESAAASYEESLEILKDMELNLELASNLHKLGYIARFRGDFQKAAQLFTDSLTMQQTMGNKQGIIECLIGLAGLATVTESPVIAVRLFAAAEESLASIGAPLGPADIAELERDLPIAQEQLSSDEFSLAWSIGTRYTLEQAVAQAKDMADLLVTSKDNSSN